MSVCYGGKCSLNCSPNVLSCPRNKLLFHFRSCSHHVAGGFLQCPIDMPHTGAVDSFVAPPHSHLSYITVSEVHAAIPVLSGFKFYVWLSGLSENVTRTTAHLRTQGHAKLFSLLLNTKTFCLSLTKSLRNCALQVWSTGSRSPTTPRNKHASESSLELSLKGYTILNSSSCNWGVLLSGPQRPAHFGVVSKSNLIWMCDWEDSCSKGNTCESAQTHTMIWRGSLCKVVFCNKMLWPCCIAVYQKKKEKETWTLDRECLLLCRKVIIACIFNTDAGQKKTIQKTNKTEMVQSDCLTFPQMSLFF